MKREDSLVILSRFAIELADAPPNADILNLIADTLKEISGAMAVAISLYDPKTHDLTLKHIAVEDKKLKKVQSLLGHRLIGMKMTVTDEIYEEMLSQDVAVSKDLYEMALGAIPKPIAFTIQKVLGIDHLRAMAIHYDGELYFTASIIMPKGKPGVPVDVMRIFAKMVAVSIRRNLAENRIVKEKERAELYMDVLGHDINNQLQGIITLHSMMLERPNLTVEDRDDLDLCLQQAMVITNLIRNVKKISKIEKIAKELEAQDIYYILFSAIENVKFNNPGRNINIITNIKEKKVIVLANELLEDVFQNIIGNAVKFDSHKTVKIEISHSLTKEGTSWKLEFKDHGKGISDEIKSTIFQRFKRGKKSVHGSGLGLAIVKRAMESYGGKVWVEDRVKGDLDKGSNFVLLFPKEVVE